MTHIAPKVELRNIDLRYFTFDGETEALSDFSLAVLPGEFVAIVGQSGCGKSTLLSLIAGILEPTDGDVLVNGAQVEGPSPLCGYMLQQDHLFEWRTILDNVLLGAEIQGLDPGAAATRAESLLRGYGLGDFLSHFPHQLSGGMRQRAALARTLCILKFSYWTNRFPRWTFKRVSRFLTRLPKFSGAKARRSFWSRMIFPKP